MRILTIAAHPDDEILGCGATMARLALKGDEVFIAILGEGITSRYPSRQAADEAELTVLQEQSRRAAEIVGVKDVFWFSLADNRFDTVPLLDIIKIIEELIEKVQPEVIYTHHGGDLNIDHGVVFRATLTATRPMAGGLVKELYTFEVPSATEWAFGRYGDFRPNTFVDVRATLETKVRALETYHGEGRPFPHPRSPEAIRALARRWGSVAGCEAAEAFELIRAIRI